MSELTDRLWNLACDFKQDVVTSAEFRKKWDALCKESVVEDKNG